MSNTGSDELEITLLPSGRRLSILRGGNLLEVLRANGFVLESDCNGMGTCGKCRVKFESGAPPSTSIEARLLQTEEIKQGWRLACRHDVVGPATITLPVTQEVLKTKVQQTEPLQETELNPGASVESLNLTPPDLDDQRSDTERLSMESGGEVKLSLCLLRRIPSILRSCHFKVSVVKEEGNLIDLVPNDHVQGLYGVAIDVGTSTLAVYLVDLETGEQLSAAASRNPQVKYGADVIARIHHIQERGRQGVGELQAVVLEAVNVLLKQLASEVGIQTSSIYKATVVGNPTMIHLLLGIDPSAIGHSPYVPVLCKRFSFQADEIGLGISPCARVEVLPAISGYVGADILAGMLSLSMRYRDLVVLMLDIGTNGEIVLATGNEMLACSTAAGPALEGGSISQGMSALAGAIDHAQIRDKELIYSIIGDAAAVGICGSGLVDLIAELRGIGLIDASGRFCKTEHPLSSRIERKDRQTLFLITNGKSRVYVTQKDVRELQLAKAAMRAGIDTLMDRAGVSAGDVERVCIGGAFGSSMRVGSLLCVGLLPPVQREKIVAVGNCAGQGAKLALLNCRMREKLEELASRTEHVELSFVKSFRESFTKHMRFPEND